TIPLEIIIMIFKGYSDLFSLQNLCSVNKQFRELVLEEILPKSLKSKFTFILNLFKFDDDAKRNDAYRQKLSGFEVGKFHGKNLYELRKEVKIKLQSLESRRRRPGIRGYISCNTPKYLKDLGLAFDDSLFSVGVANRQENKELIAFSLNQRNVL